MEFRVDGSGRSGRLVFDETIEDMVGGGDCDSPVQLGAIKRVDILDADDALEGAKVTKTSFESKISSTAIRQKLAEKQ